MMNYCKANKEGDIYASRILNSENVATTGKQNKYDNFILISGHVVELANKFNRYFNSIANNLIADSGSRSNHTCSLHRNFTLTRSVIPVTLRK